MKKILSLMLLLPFLAFADGNKEEEPKEEKAYYINITSDEEDEGTVKEDALIVKALDTDETKEDANEEEGETASS